MGGLQPLEINRPPRAHNTRGPMDGNPGDEKNVRPNPTPHGKKSETHGVSDVGLTEYPTPLVFQKGVKTPQGFFTLGGNDRP
jgi:hypothetical protein